MKKIIFTALSVYLLCSCSLYKSFKSPEAHIENVCGPEVATQDSVVNIPTWQEIFRDPLLQQLIQKGIDSNSDLQIARLGIEQAEAMLLSSKLAFVPSFALNLEGGISKSSGNKAAYSYTVPLTMQWELDLFGKLRNSKEQARSSLMQSEQYVKMVQTQIVATIANTYYSLLMLDEQLKITIDCIQNQKENLEVITAMKEAGLQTEAAVNQAAASYYSIQSSAKDLEKQIRITENSMALLINEVPQLIGRTSLEQTEDVLLDYQEVIPLKALSNRPDVKEAEYALSRSFYGINVARSAFYPSISLGGSAGWTNNIGMIVNPAKMLFSAIGALTQPLFNRGINRANLKIAKSQYEQSLLSFEKSILVAGNEVNDALISCQNSAAKKLLRQKQVEANERALANSIELMQYSSATYLEILLVQNAYLQSKLMQVSDWMEGMQGQINLYKALGGGL